MYRYIWAFPLASGEEPASNARATRDFGSTPGSGKPLEEEVATHPSVLAWRIPWAEEPGGLQSMGSRKSQT